MAGPTDIDLQRWLKGLVNRLSEGDVSAFAQRYKLDRPSLSLMVNGKRKVSEKTVYRVASRTGTPVPQGMQAFTEESNTVQHDPEPSAEGSNTEKLIAMLVASQQMTADALKRIDRMEDRIERLVQLVENQRG